MLENFVLNCVICEEFVWMENVFVNVDILVVIKIFKIFIMYFDICNEINLILLFIILEDIWLILVCVVLWIIFLYVIIIIMKIFFFIVFVGKKCLF